MGKCKHWLDLQAAEAELILCNDDALDEEKHGVAYAACHSAEAAVPSVRRRTTAAPAVRRHCDTSEPTRWRAAETPVRKGRGHSQAQKKPGLGRG